MDRDMLANAQATAYEMYEDGDIDLEELNYNLKMIREILGDD